MWNGYVGDTDTSGVIQLKGIVKDDVMFVNSVREYLWNYYGGISVLEQGGTLTEYWDDIEDELVKNGIIAIVEFGNSGEKFLADVITDERNILKGIRKTTLSLIDNTNIKFSTDPLLWKDGREKSGLSKQYLKLEPEKFVIFKNNKDAVPYLQNFDYYAQKLVNVIRKMEMDMFMSEKKLMFMVDEQPDEEDINYLIKTFQKGIFIFPNFEKSANLSATAQKQGKQGINPHNVKFELYEPKTDFSEQYIRKFNFWWDKMLMLNGVRHDVLADKDERVNNPEMKASTRTFDAFEKRAWKERMKGINEYKGKFEKSSISYILVYGDYNKDHTKS